jgi:hypothetical protein
LYAPPCRRAFGAELGFIETARIQVLVCLVTLMAISLEGLGLGQAADVLLMRLGVNYWHVLGISACRS